MKTPPTGKPSETAIRLPGQSIAEAKPVIITFDDGFESVYHYAFPLCEKYGLKFTLAVLGHESEFYSGREEHNISYSYITWEQIKELNESGMVEIANHTFNMHETEGRRGINKKKKKTEKAFTQFLKCV